MMSDCQGQPCLALVKALCRKLCSVEDLQGALETFNESAWQRRLMDKAFTVLLDLTPEADHPRSDHLQRPAENAKGLAKAYLELTGQGRYGDAEAVQELAQRLAKHNTIAFPHTGPVTRSHSPSSADAATIAPLTEHPAVLSLLLHLQGQGEAAAGNGAGPRHAAVFPRGYSPLVEPDADVRGLLMGLPEAAAAASTASFRRRGPSAAHPATPASAQVPGGLLAAAPDLVGGSWHPFRDAAGLPVDPFAAPSLNTCGGAHTADSFNGEGLGSWGEGEAPGASGGLAGWLPRLSSISLMSPDRQRGWGRGPVLGGSSSMSPTQPASGEPIYGGCGSLGAGDGLQGWLPAGLGGGGELEGGWLGGLSNGGLDGGWMGMAGSADGLSGAGDVGDLGSLAVKGPVGRKEQQEGQPQQHDQLQRQQRRQRDQHATPIPEEQRRQWEQQQAEHERERQERVVRLALLALRGVVAAVAELQDVCSRPSAPQRSAERQLLGRLLHSAHMRLRLDAFLRHHQALAAAAAAGAVVGAGLEGTQGLCAAAEGSGACVRSPDPVLQGFVACLEQLLGMQTSVVLALPEHIAASKRGGGGAHVVEEGRDWAAAAAGKMDGGRCMEAAGTLRDSASSLEGTAAVAAAGGAEAQLRQQQQPQPSSQPSPVTLLDVWLFSSRLHEQLHQLCAVCRCTPAAGHASASHPPSARTPPPTPPPTPTPSSTLCCESRCAVLYAGSGASACWELQAQLRWLGVGPSEWECGGFPAGVDLLDMLYQALLSSTGPLSLLLRLLLARTLRPLAAHIREWVFTTRPLDPGFARPLAPGQAHAPLGTLATGAWGPTPGSAQPRASASATPQLVPGALPGFLAPVQHMYEQAGLQMRVLGALQPRIGPLGERLQRMADGEARQARELVWRLGQQAGEGGGWAAVEGGEGKEAAWEEGEEDGVFPLVFDLRLLQLLSEICEGRAAEREAEVERVLGLLTRRREAEAAEAALEVVARRQERLGREERGRRVAREVEAAERGAKAQALEGQMRDAEEARARRVRTRAAEVEQEQQALLEAALREHRRAQQQLRRELGLGAPRGLQEQAGVEDEQPEDQGSGGEGEAVAGEDGGEGLAAVEDGKAAVQQRSDAVGGVDGMDVDDASAGVDASVTASQAASQAPTPSRRSAAGTSQPQPSLPSPHDPGRAPPPSSQHWQQLPLAAAATRAVPRGRWGPRMPAAAGRPTERDKEAPFIVGSWGPGWGGTVKSKDGSPSGARSGAQTPGGVSVGKRLGGSSRGGSMRSGAPTSQRQGPGLLVAGAAPTEFVRQRRRWQQGPGSMRAGAASWQQGLSDLQERDGSESAESGWSRDSDEDADQQQLEADGGLGAAGLGPGLEAPASSAVQVCMCQAVQAQYRLTTRAVWALAVQELRCMDVCAALRRFFFMEAGDFAQLLSDRLLNTLRDLGKTGSGARLQPLGAQPLALALEEARSSSSCTGDAHAARLHLVLAPGRDVFSASSSSPPSSTPPAPSAPQTYDPLAPFRSEAALLDEAVLVYSAPWPHRDLLMLQPGGQAAGAYAACFSACLRLRACHARLGAAWLALAKPTLQQMLDRQAGGGGGGSDAGGDEDAAGVRRARLARRLRALRMWHHQALHFVTGLQQHVQGELLGSCWSLLEKGLTSGPVDLAQMQAVHMRYLRRAMHVCLLPPGTTRALLGGPVGGTDGVEDEQESSSGAGWTAGAGLRQHGGAAGTSGRAGASGVGATRRFVAEALRACELYAVVSLAAPLSGEAGPASSGASLPGAAAAAAAAPAPSWYELLKEAHRGVDAAVRAAMQQLHAAASADPAAAGLYAVLGCAYYS